MLRMLVILGDLYTKLYHFKINFLFYGHFFGPLGKNIKKKIFFVHYQI